MQILLSHKQSTLGACLATADVKCDGLVDFFIGGAGRQSEMLYLQQPDGTFTPVPQ